MMKYTTDTIALNSDGQIDLSAMNLADAAKTVINLSTSFSCSNYKKTCKCKLSSEEVLNFISKLPISNSLELVL